MKTARYIQNLTEKLRLKEAICDDVERLAAERLEIAAALKASRDAAREAAVSLRERLTAAELRLGELETLDQVRVRAIAELTEDRDAARTAMRAAGASRERAERAADELAAGRDAVEAARSELARDRSLLEEQRGELAHILDGVRDRMRRRELDAERAVLNRRAVASAAPGKNHR